MCNYLLSRWVDSDAGIMEMDFCKCIGRVFFSPADKAGPRGVYGELGSRKGMEISQGAGFMTPSQ